VKALLLTAPGRLECRDVPRPEGPPGWVRVRVRSVGICGSDIHYFVEGRIGDQVVSFPHQLGHEGSGVVLDAAGRLLPGVPVYLEPAVVCHQCDQCRIGRENTCRRIRFFGNPNEFPGCMREEVVVPPENVIPLPPSIPVEVGFLLEPLCIGMYAVARSGIGEGASVAVVGCGPIGLSVIAALSDAKPRMIYATDPVGARREAARALGADVALDPSPLEHGAASAVLSQTGGVDAVYECAGTLASIDDAIHMLRPGGVLMLVGIPEGTDRVAFDHSHMRRNEITIVNVRRQNRMIGRALSLLERRPDLPDILITHRFPPERAEEAFSLVHERRDGVIKAVIDF